VTNWIPKLFTTTNKKTKQIIERSYAGVPEAESWNPNGEQIPEASINTRFKILAENGWLGQSVGYTLEMKTFDENDLMTKMAGDLANAVAVAKQKSALAFLEGGLSTVWNVEANEYLFTASHYLDPRYGSGTEVYGNLVTGAPSVSTLSDGINLLVGTPDDLGNPKMILPKFILCHTNKYLTWKQILGHNTGEAYRSDTANATPNPFSEYNIVPVACPWIQTETHAFLFGNENGLVWNEVIGFKSTFGTDLKTQLTTHLAYSAFTRYARDWRGVVCING